MKKFLNEWRALSKSMKSAFVLAWGYMLLTGIAHLLFALDEIMGI
ncbi:MULTISPECIES: hypothetical protein [Vibrio]|nr:MULTISPECIES: hypothetical protein [Vibrio]